MSILYIASDHAGFLLKQFLAAYLDSKGHEVHNLGPSDVTSCDYPESARLVTDQVLAHPDTLGILICGTGIGMSMAANRVRGIRAALAACEFHAVAARAHNNANVLCLGERVTGQGLAAAIAEAFLATPFEGGRHARRVQLFN